MNGAFIFNARVELAFLQTGENEVKVFLESSYTDEIRLSWHNVNVFVPSKKKFCSSQKSSPKQILHNGKLSNCKLVSTG